MKLLALFSLLIGSASAMAENDTARAITMEVEETGGEVVVVLRGNSRVDQRVAYDLELDGSSRSKHHGETRLAAGRPAVLSTMRMNAQAPWCIRATITEGDGRSYEYSEGDCG